MHGRSSMKNSTSLLKSGLELVYDNDNSILTAKLFGDLDHHCTIEIRKKIDSEIEKINPKIFVLDFENVKFMDSSGIGLIIGRYKIIKKIYGEIKIINTSSRIEKLLKLSGIGCIL